METGDSVAETRWPKLAGGAAVLDFANTNLVPEAHVLPDLDRFLAWCAHASVPIDDATDRGAEALAATAGAEADELADRAVALREAVLRVATAHADGEAPATADLGALADHYRWALHQAEPVLGEHGQWSWSWARRAPAVEAVARLAVEAVDVFSRPLDRLKACDACRFVFLDSSKNNSRRWCSMDDCGTKEKMRRYVAKRAAANRRPKRGP